MLQKNWLKKWNCLNAFKGYYVTEEKAQGSLDTGNQVAHRIWDRARECAVNLLL